MLVSMCQSKTTPPANNHIHAWNNLKLKEKIRIGELSEVMSRRTKGRYLKPERKYRLAGQVR
ncbi:MAG: hypothetical protein AB7D27_09835 [Desulfomicrobium sp.]